MDSELKRMVDTDILRLKSAINDSGFKESKIDLMKEMEGKYSVCIQDFYKGLWHADEHGIYITYEDENKTYVIQNLRSILSRLQGFMFNLNSRLSTQGPLTQVSVTNNNNIEVNISFDDVRNKIEEMPSLSNIETKEILNRIDDLENIIKSPNSKKSKWTKISPILKWLADKSVDVGLTLIPLIMKL